MPKIDGLEFPAYEFREWPKAVKGRTARDPEHARFLLSHADDCGVFNSHPDADTNCTCGGVEPSAEDLAAAGLEAPAAQPRAPAKPKRQRAKKPAATAPAEKKAPAKKAKAK